MQNATALQQPSPAPASLGDERRSASRQASGLLGTCRIVDAPADQLWTCEIQDVSFGGLALVLRRWFGPRTALVVQPFGCAVEEPALVAQVIRARPQGGGFWHHGCRFVKPLHEHELHALLPARPQPPRREDPAPQELDAQAIAPGLGTGRRGGTERRTSARFPGVRLATCRLLGMEAEALTVRIDNVSRTGVALRMRREATRGSVLVLALEGIGGRFTRPMLARVMNCRAAGVGVWRMGCTFVRPLTDDEVQVLLVPEAKRGR